MAQTISLPVEKFNLLIRTLSELKDELAKLVQKLETSEEPPYGSKAWWEHSEKKALKSIKRGKGVVIRSKQELDTFFNSL